MKRREGAFRLEVAKVLAALPPAFQPYLANLVVQVEAWPSAEQLEEAGLEPDETLYGLYLGRSILDPDSDPAPLPDRILIFQGPLEEDFPDPDERAEEIAITVVHEVAHHFGIGEERLEELGLG